MHRPTPPPNPQAERHARLWDELRMLVRNVIEETQERDDETLLAEWRRYFPSIIARGRRQMKEQSNHQTPKPQYVHQDRPTPAGIKISEAHPIPPGATVHNPHPAPHPGLQRK
jgi:hypothetical protein